MKIEMVEMGSEKASSASTSAAPPLEFTTLVSSLQKEVYDKLEKKKPNSI